MDQLSVLTFLFGLLVLDFAAWRWGVDSTDGPASAEWERRRAWRGYGAPDRKE